MSAKSSKRVRELFPLDYILRGEQLPLRVEMSRPQGTAAPHAHEFYELVLVFGGYGVHETARGVRTLTPGDVTGIPPGEKHSYSSDDNLRICNILFDPALAGEDWKALLELAGWHELFHGGGKLHFDDASFRQAANLADRIMREWEAKPPGWRMLSRGGFLELAALVGRAGIPCRPDALGSETEVRIGIRRAVEHLERNWNIPLVPEQLAAVSRMSRASFFRRFREFTGCTPGEYHTRLRLDRARRMLSETSLDIAEIAQRCGFCDASYLTRLFREKQHMTPRQYRDGIYRNS